MATGEWGGFAFVGGDETYAEEFSLVIRVWSQPLWEDEPEKEPTWDQVELK